MGMASGRHSSTLRSGSGGAQCVQQECDRGGSVGHGMVHLGHDGETMVGEPLDHDELPQGTIPGQRPAGDIGDHGGKLSVASRFGRPGGG